MENDELIKKADLRKIVDEGEKIYEQIKSQYERHSGKFLAIEIESKKAYMAEFGADAIALAKQHHPDKVFYLLKIGHGYTETLARYVHKKP